MLIPNIQLISSIDIGRTWNLCMAFLLMLTTQFRTCLYYSHSLGHVDVFNFFLRQSRWLLPAWFSFVMNLHWSGRFLKDHNYGSNCSFNTWVNPVDIVNNISYGEGYQLSLNFVEGITVIVMISSSFSLCIPQGSPAYYSINRIAIKVSFICDPSPLQ